MRSIRVGPMNWATLQDEDYERLNEYEWKLNKSGYAYRMQDGKRIYMHREVMADELEWRSGAWEVHHLDQNKLNNQRYNLHVCDKTAHARHHGKKYNSARGRGMRVCGMLDNQRRHTF